MRILTTFSSLTFGAVLIAGGIAFAPSFAGENRNSSSGANEQQWLSIGQISAKIEAAGYRNVEKIEREHGVYEARATNRNGTRVKLHINPQTGEISDRGDREQPPESSKRDRDSASSSANCNKRRCRDDLPAAR
jgi:hypothetical protein